MGKRPSDFAQLVAVQHTDRFFARHRDTFAWHTRLLGAGLVDGHWMEVVRRHCRPQGIARMLPPPCSQFQGLRKPTKVDIHSSFYVEDRNVAEALKVVSRYPPPCSAWTVRDALPSLVHQSSASSGAKRVFLCGPTQKTELLERKKREAATDKNAAKSGNLLRGVQLWDVKDLWEHVGATI